MTNEALRSQLLDAVLRGGTYVGPRAVYAALFVRLLSGASAEVTDANYARRPVKFGPPLFGATWNVEPLEFAQASSGYGAVVEIVLFDAPTGGNELHREPLDEIMFVPEGAVAELPAGACRVEWPA